MKALRIGISYASCSLFCVCLVLPVAAQVPNGRWNVQQRVDPLTDKKSEFAETVVAGNPRGVFDVTAGCDGDTVLGFNIAIESNGLLFKRVPTAQTLTATPGLGNQIDGQLSAPESCTLMTINVDGRIQDEVSQVCDSERRVVLGFIGNPSRIVSSQTEMLSKAAGELGQPGQPNVGVAVVQGLGALQQLLAGRIEPMLSATGFVQMKDVLNARELRVQLPFTDGGSSVIKLNLADEEFRRYAATCGVPGAGHAAGGGHTAGGGGESTMLAPVLGPDHGDLPAATSNAKDSFSQDAKTVTDQTAGLMWTQNDSGHGMSWADASKFCSSLRTGGHSDWRLPQSAELKTLYDPNGKEQAACPDSKSDAGHMLRVRSGINLSCYWVWSSTKGREIAQPDWAGGPVHTMQIFNFYNGLPGDEYPDKKMDAALCVRKNK